MSPLNLPATRTWPLPMILPSMVSPGAINDSFISMRSLGEVALDTMSCTGGTVAAGCGGGLLADVTVPVVDSGLSHRAMLYYSSCLSCLPEACYCRRQN